MQHSLKFLLVFLFCLSTKTLLIADYMPGYIILKKGDIKSGYIKKFYSNDTKVFFKENLQAKKQSFKSSKIDEIGLVTKKRDTIVFHDYQLGKIAFKKKVRKFDGHCWATCIYYSDKVEAFQFFFKDRHGFNPVQLIGLPLVIPFYDVDPTFGILFPEEGVLIQVIESDENPNDFTGRKFQRRMAKYLSIHCERFSEYYEAEKSPPEKLFEYLDFYTEKCN